MATTENCSITCNKVYGIALYQPPCCDTDSVFTRQFTGGGNVIPDSGGPNGNRKGALCPPYPGEPCLEGFVVEE